MKISAVGQRGYEAKDYIDIYFLLREMPIGRMFENFQKKYNTTDIQHYKRSVVYFDDVAESSWKSVELIGRPISPHTIKEALIREVEYGNNQFYIMYFLSSCLLALTVFDNLKILIQIITSLFYF